MEDNAARRNEIRFDALKELGNIGVGNALTAISAMIDSRIVMTVPWAGIVPIETIPEMIGGPETPVAAVHSGVTGDVPGRVAFVFQHDSALAIIDLLLGRETGTAQCIDEEGASAIAEVGNVMTSSFLTALIDMSGLAMRPTPPETVVDMAAAVLVAVLLGTGPSGDGALSISTKLSGGNEAFKGSFFYVPQPGSLDRLLSAIGVG
jgi:chemotaxis protein CheC